MKFYIYASKIFNLQPNGSDIDTINITDNFYVKQVIAYATKEAVFDIEDNTYNEKWNSKTMLINFFDKNNAEFIKIENRVLKKNTTITISVQNISNELNTIQIIFVGYRFSEQQIKK